MSAFSQPASVFAQNTGNSVTGLPIPRFVSLKSGRVNMRVGPNRDFQIKWRYTKKGLPVEVIQEYDNWRKVRDPEGEEGWILHSLLASKRTAVVISQGDGEDIPRIKLYRSASADAGQVAEIESGVVVNVASCSTDWCSVSVQNTSGFVRKSRIWGVYPDELIE